jgi:type I restriction enzyme, S subunit
MTVEKIDLNNLDKSDWKTYRFDEFATNISERIDPNNTDLEVYIGLEHIDSESLHIKRFGTPDDVNGQKLKFYKGDIIFGRRRAYQRKAGIATTDGFCSAHALVLRANPEVIDPRLFPFFLHSDLFMNRAVDISVGSLSPTINWGTLKNQHFLVPPKKIQQGLADLLSALDETLSTKQRQLESLQALPSVFFEEQMKNNPQNRTLLKEALIDIFAGKSPKGEPRPATIDEHGVLKVSAIGDGAYVESENKALIQQETFNPKYEVKPGYILVTRANAHVSGVGRPCIVGKTRKGLMLSDKTLRLIPNDEVIRERFLFQLLRTKAYRNHVESVAGGTEAKNISQKLLGNAPVWQPRLAIQDVIVAKLEAMDVATSSAIDLLEDLKIFQKTISRRIF